MDYEKIRLTPIDEVKGAEPKNEAEKAAREELKRHRNETQRYKQKYFEYYDDVKINHREDWWKTHAKCVFYFFVFPTD